MEVYIEYVVLDNLIINYIILSTTFACIGNHVSKRRKLLSVLLGTIFVVFMPIVFQSNLFLLFYRLVLGFIMVLVCSKKLTLNRFIYTYLIFIFITFLFGGLLISMLNMFDIIYTASGLIFLSVEFPTSVFILPIWMYSLCVIKVIKYIKVRAKFSKFIYQTKLVINGESFDLKGFLDTGNSLYDEDGRPCIVIELKTFYKLFSSVSISMLLKKIEGFDDKLKNVHYIMVNTINAKEKLMAFDADKLIVKNNGVIEEFQNICVAVSNKNFDEYNVILHRNFC